MNQTRILLINPQSFWKGENNAQVLVHKNFNDHLGLRYIASALVKENYEVEIIDGHFEELTFDEILKRTLKGKYDIYGISFVETIAEETIDIARAIKERNPMAKIIVGGYGATLIGKEVLRDCNVIDAAVIGEGDISTVELVKKINNKKQWKKIRGIGFYLNGRYYETEPNNLIEDLDSLPWPLRASDYPLRRANMIASKGCYGQCTYCSINEFYCRFKGKNVRVRNPQRVVDEIEYLVKKKNIIHIDFVDDNFMCTCKVNKSWGQEFVAEIKRRKLKFSWGIQARANDIDEVIMKSFKEVGLHFVNIGIENDVERVIRLFKTGTTKDMHRKAIETLRRLGINIYIEMILLEPTTTLEELEENFDFLREIDFCELYRQNPVTFSSKLHLYSGTAVLEQMRMNNIKIWKEGYHYYYEFKDPKIQKLYQAICYWQKITADIGSYQLNYMEYEAQKQKKYSLALNIVKNSKKYLQYDLYVYEEIVKYIKNNSCCALEELKNKLDQYYKNLEDVKKIFQDAQMKLFTEEDCYD